MVENHFCEVAGFGSNDHISSGYSHNMVADERTQQIPNRFQTDVHVYSLMPTGIKKWEEQRTAHFDILCALSE